MMNMQFREEFAGFTANFYAVNRIMKSSQVNPNILFIFMVE